MIELRMGSRCWALLLGIAAGSGCGAKVSEQEPLSSETHFLSRCSDRCDDGLECIAGVCTRECASTDACAELSANAECSPTSDAERTCQVPCDGNATCRAENANWSCESARCVGEARGPEPDPTPEPMCPRFAGGVMEPAEVETSAEPIPDSLGVVRAAADSSGVYWLDDSHAVFGRPRGGDTEMLRPAPEREPDETRPLEATGFVTGKDAVYVGDGLGPPPDSLPGPGPPSPPGRLWAVPKNGSEATLLYTSDSEVLYPLGVVGDDLIVTDQNRVFTLTIGDDSPALRQLSHVPSSDYLGFELVSGELYWRAGTSVFTAPVAEGEPREVIDFGDAAVSGDVLGNGEVLLFAPELLVPEPLNLVQYFEMLDLETGCQTELPSLGTSIGSAIVDDTHVYWKSYNGLGGVSPGDDLDAAVPYVRVHLQTGALEQLVSPTFHVSLVRDILAQDDESIYFRLNGDRSLVGLQKP